MGPHDFLRRAARALATPRRSFANLAHHLFPKRHPWRCDARGAIHTKDYADYAQYIRHQQSKLAWLRGGDWLTDYDVRYRETLRERLREVGVVRAEMNVLCLAARLGTEVRAFQDLGCFAVGIDLNPGPENRHVLFGDFHALQFPQGSVDVVFCNSLDHAYDLDKLLGEARRVLRPTGRLVLEIVRGEAEGFEPAEYEATSWGRIDDLLAIVSSRGFAPLLRLDISYPFSGQHVVLEPAAATASGPRA